MLNYIKEDCTLLLYKTHVRMCTGSEVENYVHKKSAGNASIAVGHNKTVSDVYFDS